MVAIRKKVDDLIKKHGTRDPIEIIKCMGIVIRYANLGNIFGFHIRDFRVSVINVNENLSYEKQLFTIAHELGHAILHPNENTAFLKASTLFSTDRLEVEANVFAVNLLFTHDVIDSITVNEAIEHYGIPKQFLIKNF